MAILTGLFTRGSSYYLRVVLPTGHPAKAKYRNRRVVLSLGACGKREAIKKGTILRAEVLRGVSPQSPLSHLTVEYPLPFGGAGPSETPKDVTPVQAPYLRDVFDSGRRPSRGAQTR